MCERKRSSQQVTLSYGNFSKSKMCDVADVHFQFFHSHPKGKLFKIIFKFTACPTFLSSKFDKYLSLIWQWFEIIFMDCTCISSYRFVMICFYVSFRTTVFLQYLTEVYNLIIAFYATNLFDTNMCFFATCALNWPLFQMTL